MTAVFVERISDLVSEIENLNENDGYKQVEREREKVRERGGDPLMSREMKRKDTSCGLYYKHITIVNDTSRAVSE